eukprot:2644001-Prymnesium_polylepis.1
MTLWGSAPARTSGSLRSRVDVRLDQTITPSTIAASAITRSRRPRRYAACSRGPATAPRRPDPPRLDRGQ